MKNFEIYKVGGCVRDKILGHDSKDIDFVFEFTQDFLDSVIGNASANVLYITMNKMLELEGFTILQDLPDYFTTKARFPKGHKYENLVADFVMCRKEIYTDSYSRRPIVSPGTIYDDLERRDFIMNAIAEDEEGNIIDPFNGVEDIKNRIISCPKNAKHSFSEDHLRMLRAIRFCITKDFTLDDEVWEALCNKNFWTNLQYHVSIERIKDELYKCFKHDTIRTMRLLIDIEFFAEILILENIFHEKLWLEPTLKSRK